MRVSFDELKRRALSARRNSRPKSLSEALMRGERAKVIAEFKRASPSKGEISEGASVAQIVEAYERGGAAAVSVLTEEDGFRGSLEDLRAARMATSLPLLRKDFIFDEYQIYESAEAGADALLLIVAALADEKLSALRRLAEDELSLDALVEVHTEEELKRAVGCGATLIGVNNRDLQSFRVSLETSARLASRAPKDVLLVSESGLKERADVESLHALGFRGFLIGESLMRADDPEKALRAFLCSAKESEAAG